MGSQDTGNREGAGAKSQGSFRIGKFPENYIRVLNTCYQDQESPLHCFESYTFLSTLGYSRKE